MLKTQSVPAFGVNAIKINASFPWTSIFQFVIYLSIRANKLLICCPLCWNTLYHMLNIGLHLQSLFRLHVRSCAHWLRPRNPFPHPPHLGSFKRCYWSATIDDIRDGADTVPKTIRMVKASISHQQDEANLVHVNSLVFLLSGGRKGCGLCGGKIQRAISTQVYHHCENIV